MTTLELNLRRINHKLENSILLKHSELFPSIFGNMVCVICFCEIHHKEEGAAFLSKAYEEIIEIRLKFYSSKTAFISQHIKDISLKTRESM